MPDARAPILVSDDSGNNNNDNDNDSFSSLYAHALILVSDDSGNNSDDNGAVGANVRLGLDIIAESTSITNLLPPHF